MSFQKDPLGGLGREEIFRVTGPSRFLGLLSDIRAKLDLVW